LPISAWGWRAGKETSRRRQAIVPISPMIAAPHLSSLDAAISWVVGGTARLAAETAPLLSARYRVLAEEIRTAYAIPKTDRAALDGFAVAASATVGASSYNPLPLPLHPISAGEPMPPNTDAVIPLDLGQTQAPDVVECIDAVAPGENVAMRGSVAAAGTLLASATTVLSPAHVGMLISIGLANVEVVRRPRVQIVVAPGSSVIDSNGPMCRALTERDGGVVAETVSLERSRPGFRSALGVEDADLILVIGGTGRGSDDHAAAALAEAGELAMHGIAMRPGETSGLGRTQGGLPVILLPGSPAACLFSYEMLAGRAVRRMGGRDPALPYRSRAMRTARKIVSAIGMTEICPLRCAAPGVVEPLPSLGETGLMSAITADGFLIVPEASEGYPRGASVTVYLYEGSLIGG
jgi:molybdopterin molybdotransferase